MVRGGVRWVTRHVNASYSRVKGACAGERCAAQRLRGRATQHDLELAERNYRIAERGMAGSPPATSFEVSEALGEILMLRGRYDESAERFERARALAANDIAVARMEGRLGELVFRR